MDKYSLFLSKLMTMLHEGDTTGEYSDWYPGERFYDQLHYARLGYAITTIRGILEYGEHTFIAIDKDSYPHPSVSDAIYISDIDYSKGDEIQRAIIKPTYWD